ncbi:hypothetical protein C1645_742003 [Glomus cerebriforme]|uniref:Uncharacterized protein n=1 Tax=Glomus cerebriforme TaxID=658196 RepID=A0A397SFV7_9GLOM|nr:hypothetical protein C1645_742003 [Glomus cerebriforme]
MYNQSNNYHQTSNSKVNPGGFIAPNSVSYAGGFRDPNATTNPGGFRIPTQPIYHNNNYHDKHRNSTSQYPPISTVNPYPPTTEDNRRDSMPIKGHNNQVESNSNSNNIVQSPINVTAYPPYKTLGTGYPPPSQNSYPLSQNQTYSSITNPVDLQRRFYGTCRACDKPNSDFAECSSCKNWILQMETMINARKSLINQQLCAKCQLPKHVHSQMAACAECGFPKSHLEELNKIAIKNENENDNDNNNNNSNSGNTFNSNDKKIGLICGNCNHPLVNYLKCPSFIEIAQRMRKERECLPYEDPNFAKLSKIIKQYSDLEKQKDTNSIPARKCVPDDDTVNELQSKFDDFKLKN